MRTQHHSAMRVMNVALIAASALGTAVIGGGIYQYFAAFPKGDRAASNPFPPASTEVEKTGRSFIIHETPLAVPELSFVDGEGHEMSLADFGGRTILLNIWATWCVPCREEMPALDRLQAKLGNSGFEVVPLSIDRNGLPAVNAFYQELGLEALGIYVDASGKAVGNLGAVGIPTTLLINPEGLEAGRLVGPAEWDGPEIIEILQQQFEMTADDAD
jgi:thiol-disulfide isomerase/thioredoxin